MRKWLLVAGLSLLLATPAAARGELRIESSAGGRIGDYMQLFAMVRDQKRRVVIDGPCFSACTLVLSIVPRGRICVTNRAILGFHAAWRPDWLGRQRTHPEATRLMLATYPAPVRSWIKRRGGLTSDTLILRGRELNAMYRRCR